MARTGGAEFRIGRSTISTRRKELYTHSLLWGILAFAGGVAVTLLTLPEPLKSEAIPDWKIATWVWLNAHGVPIARQAVTGSALDFGSLDFIAPTPELHLLRVLPIFLVAIACLVVVNAIGGYRNDGELAELVVYAVGGYVVAGVGAIAISGARPDIVGLLMIFGVVAVAAYLGAMLANSLPIPVFAITSIGGLVGIGLLVLLGIGAVLEIAVPLGKYAVGGGLIALVAMWVSDNIDV